MQQPAPDDNIRQTVISDMAKKMYLGTFKPKTPEQIAYLIEAKRTQFTWDQYCQIQDEASIMADRRRQREEDKRVAAEAAQREKEAKEFASRRAAAKDRSLAAAAEFVANDNSAAVTPGVMDKMTSTLEQLIDDEMLEAFNKPLRTKTGAITHRDIAFIGCIHRLSVTDNGSRDERFEATSPFKRIREASIKFKYRDTAFDHRQIRAALSLLQVVEFTEEQTKGVHSHVNPKASTAGTWTISSDPFWRKIFI